jgi:hypothetical protein
MTMRLKRDNLCPHCQAPVEPTWLFCLACGDELPRPEDAAGPPEPAIPRTRDGKYKCWQCKTKLDTPSPACPKCGAELDKPRDRPKKEKVESNGVIGNLSLPMILLFLLFGAVLFGAGAVMLTPKGDSTDSEQGFSLPSLSDIPIPRIFGDDDVSAGDKPEGVSPAASEARVVSVADDGLIRLRIDGQEINVYLAGASPSFVTQCLGEKALARVRRILVDEGVVFVALDGKGAVSSSPKVATQSVYLWQYDSGTGKVRFVNQELLGGGEVAYVKVKLKNSEAGKALIAASERAKAKERGRYEPGACE